MRKGSAGSGSPPAHHCRQLHEDVTRRENRAGRARSRPWHTALAASNLASWQTVRRRGKHGPSSASPAIHQLSAAGKQATAQHQLQREQTQGSQWQRRTYLDQHGCVFVPSVPLGVFFFLSSRLFFPRLSYTVPAKASVGDSRCLFPAGGGVANNCSKFELGQQDSDSVRRGSGYFFDAEWEMFRWAQAVNKGREDFGRGKGKAVDRLAWAGLGLDPSGLPTYSTYISWTLGVARH